MSNRVCKEEQVKLIMECRQSGLSDYQWCEQNGIYPGTFYNWVSKLRKKGYTFPEPVSKSKAVPNIQKVVKLDFVDSTLEMEQNVSLPISTRNGSLAAELLLGNITLRLYNGADEQVIQNTIRCIGGLNHAW